MYLRIGGVAKLVRQISVGSGGHQFLGIFDRAFHSFGSWSEHQFRTQSGEKLAPFDCHGLGHG